MNWAKLGFSAADVEVLRLPQCNSFNQGVARQAAALRFGRNVSRTLAGWAHE